MDNNTSGPKKSFSISLVALLLLIAIIAIGVMGYFLFTVSNENKTAHEDIQALNSRISELENTISTLNIKSGSTTNTSNTSSSNKTSNSNKYTKITDELDDMDVLFVTSSTKNDDNTYTLKGVLYTEYTLTKDEVDKCIKDKKMTVAGEEYIVTQYYNTEKYILYKDYSGEDIKFDDIPVAYTFKVKDSDSNLYYLERNSQIKETWKLTDDYKEITLDKDITVEDSLTGEESTVEEVFGDFKKLSPKDTTSPYPAYTFEFKNGKCVKVIRATTGL